MDPNMLRSLFDALLAPYQDNIQNAQNELIEFISKPESIHTLFSFYDNADQRYRMMCIMLIKQYMSNNYFKLDPDLQNKIIYRLFDLIIIEDRNQAILGDILCQYIRKNDKQVSTFLQKLDSIIVKNGEITELTTLSKLVSFLDKDAPILIEYKDKLFEYCLIGLKLSDHHLVDQSIELYTILKEKNFSVLNEPHLDLIINILTNCNYNNDVPYYEALVKLVSKKLIPQEKIDQICNLAFYAIRGDQRNEKALFFLIKSNQKFDKSRFLAILDTLFDVLKEDDINTEYFKYFDYLAKNLQKNSIENIYGLLMQKINQLLVNPDYIDCASAALTYIIVFKVYFKEFYADINSFVQNMHNILTTDEDSTNHAVCYVLNNLFQDYFKYDDFIAIEFLPDILTILQSENFNLINEAADLFSSFLDIIDTIPSTVFDRLWEIRDSEICCFYSILAKVIDMDKTIDSNQLKSVADFIQYSIENSNCIYLIVVLIKKDKDLIDTLLPYIFTILKNDSITHKKEKINFINLIYNHFGSLFDPQLQLVEDDVKKIISEEIYCNEEIKDSSFILECSTFAKNTGDKKLALQIEKICIKLLMNYDQNTEEDIDDECEYYDDQPSQKIDIEEILKSCREIIKLLDEKELKKIFYHVNLFTINATNQKIASEGLITLKKLLHNSCDEDKQLYLSKCNKILDKIFTGSLKALKGNDVLSESVNIDFLDSLGDFISMVVRYQSPYIETITNFILKVVKTSQNEIYYPMFVSSFFDLFHNKTCTEKVQEEIIDLMPQIIENAKGATLKQNIAFSLTAMAQYDEKTLHKVIQFVPVLKKWYHDEKNAELHHQDLLSTIASALFVFIANESEIDTGLLNEILDEFPSKDKYDMNLMIQFIVKIFTSNKLDSNSIQNAAFALSKLFLLNDFELKKIKVSPELLDSAKKLFISFSKSDPEIKPFLIQKYKHSDEKITKLEGILNQ